MPHWPWKKPRPGVDEYGRSPLWYHAAKGDLAAIAADLRTGQSPTSADKDNYTSLHVAAQNGHADVITALLKAGADPNVIDRHGNGPLWVAGYEAAKNNSTPERYSIVTLLLKAGANPDQVNKAGRTPQMWRDVSPAVEAAYLAAG